MKINRSIAAAAATLTLAAVPALALANSGNGNGPPSWAHNHQGTTGTTGTTGAQGPSSKAKAYGKFCQGESKKHVKGQKGTPFSKCVTDMAHLANGSATNPHSACKNESKKHVKGQKGTPYSVCVSGAKKLLKSQS